MTFTMGKAEVHCVFDISAKLVRGAYMVAEENEAKSQGHPCPVHDGIQATHNSYNSTANWLLQKIRDNSNRGDKSALFLLLITKTPSNRL
ncbi:PUT1 [Bugula neritina]|uniref:Proline dehydrogenase n=1 Tax=Bugula neritina TaxID=10212 RepID=A0A7J7JXS8_BUGNE|nr:PUT1 [Bugula neritina]